MKIHTQIITLLLLFCCLSSQLVAQQIDFELHYNDATSQYEVYATPDSTNALYFVGGGSQISILLPQDLENIPLQINSVAGGFWTDNSQVYKPNSDHIHDFHGIATNGAMVNFVDGDPLLLFTFELPGGACRSDIRIFENSSDPASNRPGMAHADFQNFFANVFDPFQNSWKNNDILIDYTCIHAPRIDSDELSMVENTSKTICIPIFDPNVGDTFEAQLCDSGNGFSKLKMKDDEICLTYTPSIGYVGTEDVCIEVCDQTGLCNTGKVAVAVTPLVAHSTFTAYAEECQNLLDWTIHTPEQFLHYELERSEDGENFVVLGQFESDIQLESQQFHFEDNNILRDYHYRLKLVFTDESSMHSEAVFVRNECNPETGTAIASATLTAFANNCQNVIDLTILHPSGCTYYELQRSDDGQQYEMLEQFASENALNSQAIHFIDNDVTTNHHYRLMLMMEDGSKGYSDVVLVQSDCDMEGGLVLYPNPVSHGDPVINVKFYAESTKQSLIISDVRGRTLRRISLKVEVGLNTLRLDVSDLSTGNYFLLLEGKNEISKSFSKIDERF